MPPKAVPRKKNDKAKKHDALLIDQTQGMTTTAGAPKKKGKELPPDVERSISTFVRSHTNDTVPDDVITGLYKKQIEGIVVDKGAYKKSDEMRDKNRYPQIPCLDANRIVLQPLTPDGKESDYIHANKVVIENVEREYIATQAPKDSTSEDFWRMVFQESSPVAVVLCNFFEGTAQKCHQFWPLDQGSYMYCGKMFVNNKKVKHLDQVTTYILEVLPEGCSNSLIVTLMHCTTWIHNKPPSSRMLARVSLAIEDVLEPGPVVTVSAEGIGRASAFIAIDSIIKRLLKGVENTKVLETCVSIRKQRALAFPSVIQFMSVYVVTLSYLKCKDTKHMAAVDAFRQKMGKVYSAN